MDTFQLIIIVISLVSLLALIGITIWLAMRLSHLDLSANTQIANLSGKIDAIQKQVESNLQSVTSQVSIFGEVKEKLGKVTEATDRVAALGEDIGKLQTILQSTNRRGGFGEILLGNLLSQTLPANHFCLQYTFKDNERVDAVIILGDRILPVDSKFPLQGFYEERGSKAGFKRNVKNRMDETAKYIRPYENTFEFAMMYIPAENIYYEIISNEELFNYAMQKRVIPVSPNSFFAYLQVIIYGLRGMKIEESTRYILKQLTAINKMLDEIQEHYQKLGVNIQAVQNKYNEIDKKLGRFGSQIESITTLTIEGVPYPEVLPDSSSNQIV